MKQRLQINRHFIPIAIPVALLLAVSLLFGGAWSIASAAQGAEPGDTLYPVKAILEKAQIAISPSVVIDDGAVDDIDDGAVGDIDDGAVDDIDDGALADIDAGAVDDIDDGA